MQPLSLSSVRREIHELVPGGGCGAMEMGKKLLVRGWKEAISVWAQCLGSGR